MKVLGSWSRGKDSASIARPHGKGTPVNSGPRYTEAANSTGTRFGMRPFS